MTPVYTPPPKASRCLSIVNIHGTAGIMCVGYGLEVGCSGWGRGILCRYMHGLFIYTIVVLFVLIVIRWLCEALCNSRVLQGSGNCDVLQFCPKFPAVSFVHTV